MTPGGNNSAGIIVETQESDEGRQLDRQIEELEITVLENLKRLIYMWHLDERVRVHCGMRMREPEDHGDSDEDSRQHITAK